MEYPNCGQRVDGRANSCPGCGYDLRPGGQSHAMAKVTDAAEKRATPIISGPAVPGPAGRSRAFAVAATIATLIAFSVLCVVDVLFLNVPFCLEATGAVTLLLAGLAVAFYLLSRLTARPMIPPRITPSPHEEAT